MHDTVSPSIAFFVSPPWQHGWKDKIMSVVKNTGKGPTMVVIAEKLDTLGETVVNISDTVTAIREKQIANDVHMTNIIGPPSLEDRMRQYVNEQDAHKTNNHQQALIQTQTILQLEQKNCQLTLEAQIKAVDTRSEKTEFERAKNHEENGARFAKLERNFYIGIGALGAIEFVVKLLWK